MTNWLWRDGYLKRKVGGWLSAAVTNTRDETGTEMTSDVSNAVSPDTADVTPITALTIEEAHDRIRSRIHRTEVLTSHSIDAMAGARLYFKCENFQKTGSFKIRGASNTILSLTDREVARGVVTLSSGNHGAAVACAAGWLGVPAWIVMPKDAPRVKCRAVESYGGKIVYCEPTVSARAEMAARVQQETGAVMVHPYDDDRIVAGQATAAKELLEQVPDLDAILCPVSGGGLLSGTCLSAKMIHGGVRVFGCGPERADDAYRSITSGELQRLESSDTIADGLKASLAARTFAILRKYVDGILLVTEDEIKDSMRLVAERMKILIEPSCSIALAPLLRKGGVAALGLRARADGPLPKIGILVSGGNVDLDRTFGAK